MDKNKWQYIFAGSITLALVIFVVILMFVKIPTENEKLLYLIMGALIGVLSTNINSGSETKKTN
jgi:hypothetical protein